MDPGFISRQLNYYTVELRAGAGGGEKGLRRSFVACTRYVEVGRFGVHIKCPL